MEFEHVTTIEQLSNFSLDLLETETVIIDIETTGLDPYFLTILLIQIHVNNKTYVLDARSLSIEIIKDILLLIKASNKIVINHNLKFDLKALKLNYGVDLTNLFDTMLAERIIYMGIGDLYPSLYDLTLKYCSTKLDKSVRETFINYSGPITQEQIVYSVEDVIYLNRIYESQLSLLEASGQLEVAKMEMKLIPVIVDMELTGVYIDSDLWESLAVKAASDAGLIDTNLTNQVIEKILEKVGNNNAVEVIESLGIKISTKRDRKLLEPITISEAQLFLRSKLNLVSPKQMKNILKLFGVDVKDTNKKTLKPFNDNEFIMKLLELKERVKKADAFGEAFLDKVNPITHRIHCEFSQLGTATGRFSSKNPNLQQIPRGSDYRTCWKAAKGKKLVTVDFSQQELRILAAVSGEEKMVEAYLHNEDLHAKTASLVFDVDLNKVTKEQRQTGKTLNFATVYGTSEYGLNYNFGYELNYAKTLLTKFWKGYPTLNEFMREARESIFTKKRSRTPLGRRRYFKQFDVSPTDPEYRKKKGSWENSIKRQGFNQIIQGCGADVTKLSMINIYYNNPFGNRLKILMVIHDEIVCEVDEDIAEEALKFITKSMLDAEQPFLGVIPAEVDGKISDHWEK